MSDCTGREQGESPECQKVPTTLIYSQYPEPEAAYSWKSANPSAWLKESQLEKLIHLPTWGNEEEPCKSKLVEHEQQNYQLWEALTGGTEKVLCDYRADRGQAQLASSACTPQWINC